MQRREMITGVMTIVTGALGLVGIKHVGTQKAEAVSLIEPYYVARQMYPDDEFRHDWWHVTEGEQRQFAYPNGEVQRYYRPAVTITYYSSLYLTESAALDFAYMLNKARAARLAK